MNPDSHSLDRLLRAAAQAPARPLDGLSFATESRTLHAWRSSRAGAELRPVLRLWHTGLAAAFGVAALTISVSYFAGRQADLDSADPYTATAQQLAVAINSNWQP